jgi:putative transposase
VVAAGGVWSPGFMSDAPTNGRKSNALAVLDLYTRECLAIRVEPRFSSERVAKALEGPAYLRGVPEAPRVDGGPEFTGRVLDLWAHFSGMAPDPGEPGEPTGGALIEGFDGRSREGCLDQRYFTGLGEARATAEGWRVGYDEGRPHGALGDLAPREFARSKAGVKKPRSSRKLA